MQTMQWYTPLPERHYADFFQWRDARISGQGGQGVPVFGSLPQMLPDGKSILYTEARSAAQGKVVVRSLLSLERKELVADAGILARYLPTGHIIYSLPNDNSLWAVPFNLENSK